MFKAGYEDSKPPGMNKIIGIRPIKKPALVPEIHIDQENDNSIDLLLKEAEKQLAEARKEAEKLINEARSTIEREREEWQKEKQELESQAQERGLQAGLQEGREQGHGEYRDLIELAVEVIDQAKKEYQEIILESEEVILNIALSAASKILRTEVEKTDHYTDLVKYVLNEVKEQTKITVYAHPEDYKLLLTQKEELLNIVHFKADLSLYPDGQLQRGACLIESPYGLVNAGVESQLLELRERLFELAKEKANANG